MKFRKHLISLVGWWTLPLIFFYFIYSSKQCIAQEIHEPEEVLIFLNVEKIGGTDINAYVDGNLIYLPVSDVFSFIKIQNTPSPGFDSVSGFFLDPKAVFLIERTTNRIHYQNKIYELKPGDLIQTENNLYLKSDYFGLVFGLNCTFNTRYLSVFLNTKLELPVIREIRLQTMRTNIARLKGDMKTDTTIKRNYPFFHFGTADWSISAAQTINDRSIYGINLTLGSLLAGGEANINLHYNSNQPFQPKQQSWL